MSASEARLGHASAGTLKRPRTRVLRIAMSAFLRSAFEGGQAAFGQLRPFMLEGENLNSNLLRYVPALSKGAGEGRELERKPLGAGPSALGGNREPIQATASPLSAEAGCTFVTRSDISLRQ